MITTGSIYREHEKIMSQVKLYVKNQSLSLRYCEDQAIYTRITQIISRLTAEEYMIHVDTHGKISDEILKFKHCRINIKTGECNVRFITLIRGIFKFFAYWFYYLIVLFKAFFINKDNDSPVTLLLDFVPNIEKNDSGFVDFCRNGKIKPLQKANTIVSRVKVLPDTRVDPVVHKYTKRNPLEYVITNCLKGKELASLFIEHLLLPVYFLIRAFNSSFYILLGQDLSLINIANYLNRGYVVDAMIMTTSGFDSQPIWMNGLKNRNHRLHMLWYSQNFIPKIYRNEKEGSNLPGAKLMSVDEHWVWTDGFSQFLKSLGLSSKINVVGPILWYLEDINYVPNDALQIILFDVTPREGANPYACLKNYYSVELMEKFVLDAVKICNKLSEKYTINISVLLKHKRDISKTHSKRYLNFIDSLVNDGDIRLLDHNVNTFSLIKDSLLSISVPYTSTAYVSAFLKKIGIYYDPFSEISPVLEKNEYLQFASNYDDLTACIESAVMSDQNI